MTDFVTLLAAPLTAVTAFWKDCELGPYHFLGLLASWFMTWRCRRWEGVIPVTGSVAEGKLSSCLLLLQRADRGRLCP